MKCSLVRVFLISIFLLLAIAPSVFAKQGAANKNIKTVEKIATLASESNVEIVRRNPTWPYFNEEISSRAAYVMDADSSVELFSYNANEKLYPASLTKIMTAIVVLEKANGNFDDIVTFSYNSVTRDIDRNSVTIGASAGDQLSVKDCLYSLLLPSANDAANALAEHYAGSINDFALLMNEKAENLGLKNTHFVNPSGLHDDNQYTTASDMAKILQCAMSYPIFLQISSSVSYKHAPIRRYKDPENSNNQILNTNSIMVRGSKYYYDGITSGKTGHTNLAGYNLAASAKKNNMHLICVILGGKNDGERFNDAKKLFDFHFNNYKSLSIKDTDPRFVNGVNTISIDDVAIIKTLDITCNDTAHITLPKDKNYSDVISNISYQIKDIYNKYAIGNITYYLDNVKVGECSLEGRNIENQETIFTSQLDLQKPISENRQIIEKTSVESETVNTNALIYTDEEGKLVFSKTLITTFVVAILIVALLMLFVVLYTSIINSKNIPIGKMIFRFRRFIKKK